MISLANEINKIVSELKDYQIREALDLGCGDGRISLKLVEKGIKVTGVDVKEYPIDIKNKNFTFIKEDVRNFKFDKKFDLIVCSLLLHFFRKDRALEIIKNMQKSTPIHGINLIIGLSDQDDFSKKKLENLYLNKELLVNLYSGWEILRFVQDFTDIETHDNLAPHRHNIIILLARKTG